MADAAPTDRHDTKFIVGANKACATLLAVCDDYRVLEVGGTRLQRYRTVYFDTPGLRFYRDHFRGRPVRYKVRCREYIENGLSFPEVKARTRQGHTWKARMPIPGLLGAITEAERPFLDANAPYPLSGPLLPLLQNEFRRLTLVSRERDERVTVDFGIRFAAEGRELVLEGIAVAEVKDGDGRRCSPFVDQMRREGIRASSLSKYCVGIALLHDDIRSNVFKPELLKLKNIMGGQPHV